MILILSQEKDTSTSHVIDWLIHFGIKFIRFNEEDRFIVSSFELSNNNFVCKLINVNTDEIIDITKVNGVWYRRGDIVFLDETNLESDFAGILTHIKKEYEVLHDFILNYLEKLPRLDSYFRNSMNKLEVLSVAKSVGLLIPNTFIFQGKFPVSFTGTYITKSIFELFKYKIGETTYYTPTSLIDIDEIKEKKYIYSLSQVQHHIEKECDVRIFYLRGKLYSMAILSQNNEKSKIDFRHYPSDPPNRSFPVQLPKVITESLIKLMTKLELDSGSIDMVLDTNGQFFFLEVNPVGQFGMTSVPCNYLLEKEIAKDISLLLKRKI